MAKKFIYLLHFCCKDFLFVCLFDGEEDLSVKWAKNEIFIFFLGVKVDLQVVAKNLCIWL